MGRFEIHMKRAECAKSANNVTRLLYMHSRVRRTMYL